MDLDDARDFVRTHHRTVLATTRRDGTPQLSPVAAANRSQARAVTTLIFNPAQKREGFFYGLQRILTATPVNPQEYLALYSKYDSYPVDTTNMLPV